MHKHQVDDNFLSPCVLQPSQEKAIAQPLPEPKQMQLVDESGLTPEAEKMGDKVSYFDVGTCFSIRSHNKHPVHYA